MQRVLTCVVLATVAVISCSCGPTSGVKTKTKVDTAQRPVAQDATKEELLEKYNHIALNVKTVNMTVQLKPTAGSKYSGVIDEYHEVKAFLLAARPGDRTLLRTDRSAWRVPDRNSAESLV